MKGSYLGELEELVLLTVGALHDDAYGVGIMDEIAQDCGRKINISAIHSVLKRLEGKGYLESKMGGATHDRGGRRKRYFTLTASGMRVLEESMELRSALYKRIPSLKTSL